MGIGAEEEDDQSPAPAVADDSSIGASDLLVMVTRLRRALGDARGKLRVSDAHVLGGLERQSYYQTHLIAHALRHLGWERGRYRFDGTVRYAYVKGTRLQRENILEITRGEDGQFVVKRRDP